MGIRPAEATRLVRAVAARAQADAPEPALVGCWISPAWSTGLTIAGHPDWPRSEGSESGIDGLVAVLVARRHRYDRVSVCGYLTDAYCLGVKNAMGPDTMDEIELRAFKGEFFSGYHDDPLEAPIELARDVVLGAVEYAHGLGFEPHPDFTPARAHLGPWTGPSAITFGKNGKPFYISGPYDNPDPVIRTLRNVVGEGNFDFLAVAG